jgi:hypothetical protein
MAKKTLYPHVPASEGKILHYADAFDTTTECGLDKYKVNYTNLRESVTCKLCKERLGIEASPRRSAIRKVIEMTSTVEDSGSVWGMDTDVGNIDELIDKAEGILKPYLK